MIELTSYCGLGLHNWAYKIHNEARDFFEPVWLFILDTHKTWDSLNDLICKDNYKFIANPRPTKTRDAGKTDI